MKLFCKSVACGWEGHANFSMSGDHIKASCPRCSKYIKFVKLLELDREDLANLKKWQEREAGVYSEYKRGFLDALECFAWWRDGVQYVGQGFVTLKDAQDNPEALEYYKE